MFKRLLCTSFTILCLIITLSAASDPRLSRTQSSFVCTGASCSMRRPNPVAVEGNTESTEPSKKLNRFSYGKARIGNLLQRGHHQIKRLGYVADGKMHNLFGAIDLVDKEKARRQKDKVVKLRNDAQDLKAKFKEQRRPSSQIGRTPQFGRSSTFAGSSGVGRPVFSLSRE